MNYELSKEDGRRRVVIEEVQPQIDCGQFPAKRVEGDRVVVEADVFTDGHDSISARLLWKREGAASWEEEPLTPLVNDRWRGEFTVGEPGIYLFSVRAWVDRFLTWFRDMRKRVDAGQDVAVQYLVAAELIEKAIESSAPPSEDRARLEKWITLFRDGSSTQEEKNEKLFAGDLPRLMERYSDRRFALDYPREIPIVVDRERARFSAWYEMFPRSTGTGGEHGTFATAAERLPYVAEMGFDVLYLPPIHPIGTTFRKGKNNALEAEDDDVGSPWAIGSEEGGHTSVHPQLGTLEEFRDFVAKAAGHGLEIALDIAYQVSPDHPWVREHPEWFRQLPDGTIQYAENPPKKYQDIYPIDFESAEWESLWKELREVFLFWIDQGVKIFRVDNPHTKAFRFWEWAIADIRRKHPDVIFLSEAFTRPKIMYRLAKAGFTQSYTYFTWRNSKFELEQYLTELTRTRVREFFRPNFWPNTPDILHESLQYGGRPNFAARLILASTLSSNYGIYGPAYELLEHTAREHGSEEYRDSEKYQLRDWNLRHPQSLSRLIARINRIRNEHPALHSNDSLRFHPIDNDQLICYSKRTSDHTDLIVVIVNLDPHHRQAAMVHLELTELAIDPDAHYELHDLITGSRYIWSGRDNYVEIDPHVVPAHIFSIRRRILDEHDYPLYER
jgi:starch synthase (maltosyl-transferring)